MRMFASSLAAVLIALVLWAAVACMDGPGILSALHRPVAESKRVVTNGGANVFDATATFRVGNGKKMTLRLEFGDAGHQRSTNEAE